MAVLSLTNQPPGVRFSPTDVELIDDYLKKKINGNDEEEISFIPQHNFYKREPWEWPDFSGIESKDLEWFFFSPPDLKNPNSTNRFNRATKAGYWKVTGKDLEIWSGEGLIGIKKFLVFHEGRTPDGQKTDWVMHEYHATPTELDGTNPGQMKSFVLCRLFKRPSQGSNGRKRKQSGKVGPAKSKRTQALSSVSPALMQAEDYPTIDGTTSDSRAPVECGDNYFNVSSPNTAKSSHEEAESYLRQASVSGEEVTRCNPTKTIDGTTSNTISFIEYNDNAYITKNQAAEVKAREVVDSPPELPDIDWSSLPTLLSLDPISPDELILYNDHPSSQKNLAFDRVTMENMESDKDDGSHSTAIAEMRNALLFDPTVQDAMWSEEINRKASSGLLNPGSSSDLHSDLKSSKHQQYAKTIISQLVI